MDPNRLNLWEKMGQAKIVLQISNEKELNDYLERTIEEKIPSFVVERVFGNGVKEKTLLGIGPGYIIRVQRRN